MGCTSPSTNPCVTNISDNLIQFVFPNAGLTLAAIQVGKVLQSEAINGICSALTIMLVIMWIVCFVANINAVVHGRIMWPGKDEDKDMWNLGWGRFSA